ncbi:UDP-N-acetylmuramoyl-L-alanyl-D-glutamate--2,6-diaminopimelate ligase [Gordonia sp. PDNC005]|uniref:UDP-N-acetylmuramoyl-L-alanyl-D-glutamate--2, 6-diaminopimelate ligase n=1 Tax=unclassified Gordonia (in: high G+C Gram-positive bacteria) TaxID=2657482 RepID=UPI0019626119|nr:UDP-N-acetylmuramoyl-L-alanyl-D-glutamate--2,6-diaminopimelate ligase [Gordonia sp. PDNC005]QRY60849.1 UDP-N-acetylmuramoyl-L-alanyl-D-glutamate--2,6-diaminopimelate ligase [Gordonia sp. PDNC005]
MSTGADVPRNGFRPATDPVLLSQLAALSGATLDGSDIEVSGITLRAQAAGAGDVFAAMAGTRTHGATYVSQAEAAGAVAVFTDPAGLETVRAAGSTLPVLVHPEPRSVLGAVSARVYGDPSSKLTLIGITGTSGKTTTSYLAEAALRASGKSVGLVGTTGSRIDGEPIPSDLTTPEAPDLQRLLAVMLERGADAVVMEVSSHALSLGRVDGCRFAVGAFTNLSQDHLDYHKTMDEYFDAKARLFAAGSPNRAARTVICVDDEWGVRMARIASDGGHPTVTVSTGGTVGDWRVSAVVSEARGSQRVSAVSVDGIAHDVLVPLPGAYNIANALVALATVDEAGVDVDVAIRGLADVAVPGRVEKIDRGQDFLAVVDYAHKPAAVEAVLATLAADTDGRIAVVLGAGGDRDTEKRPLMGAAAVRAADLVIVTDDNPRSEDPSTIRAAVVAGADAVPASERRASDVREIGDRRAAITAAVAWARSGDVVLVAGKGHETGQEINGVKHPFDDREVLGEALDATSRDATLHVLIADPGADVPAAKRLLREMVAVAADSGAGSAHRSGDSARTWAVFGELADPTGSDDNTRAVDHDGLGRQAVRVAVDKIIAVGTSRVVRALHQGAVMEGSWGDEAAFVETPAAAVDHMRTASGYRPGPGDVVVVAGPDDLAPALIAFWQNELHLQVRRVRV